MPAPFVVTTVTGYNDNPPPDDGSESEENRVRWETIKEKLADPKKTAFDASEQNTLEAFGKIIGGAGVVSSAISATVGASDQGKLYVATGAGITITTPDATSEAVGSPFWFAFLNTSGSTVTLEGNGSQTVNGATNITIPPAGGGLVATDGTNWFYAGVAVAPVGPGQILNGTITESNATNAVTFAVKTLAGNDPSAGDPVFACFRNATQGTGNYVFRAITSALSLTIPSGATMGASNNVSFNIALVLFDDAGTIRLGAINATNLALAKAPPIASSTTIGTGADSENVFYTGTGVSSKAYIPFAVARYPSGLATAGSWNVSPTTLQLFGPDAPAPNGPTRQVLTSGSSATYTTPTGARQLRIRMVGGGGGGGGASSNAGSSGGTTSFGSWTAVGGSGGNANQAAGGAGGSGGASGAGTQLLRYAGARGGSVATDSASIGRGGGGGPTPFGAGMVGLTQPNTAGTAGPANSGAGGSGGSSGSTGGGGGGAGEYVEFIITGPSSSYTYTIGTAGSGGSAGGQAGGDGGSGVILVEEHY